MVRYVVVAGCSAGEAARIYALLVLLVLVGLSPARARVSTVLGEISHLDELKLTKRSSARFLKAGGIIDGSDLEEIFQAIPHLRGGPRRPPRRRKLKTCGENWCFGSCPSGFWTTFGGCGGARRLRDVGRYAACPQGVWRSKRGIGCCDGGPIQEGADEGINDYCTTCTPCGPNKYQDLGGCIGIMDSVCRSCPPGRTVDEFYDISGCDPECNAAAPSGCKPCYIGIENACKKDCKGGEVFVRQTKPDGTPGPGTCRANSCMCTGGNPLAPCPVSGEHNCATCYKGRQLVGDKCQFCDEDSYQDEVSSMPCKKCPDGWSTLGNIGMNFCEAPCQAGKYFKAEKGEEECVDCMTGMYSGVFGFHTACKLCPAGTYNTELGMANITYGCKACADGKFSSVLGANLVSYCESCLAGTFSDSSSGIFMSSCVQCYKGKYTEEVGAKFCKRCPLGKFQPKKAKTAWSDCQDCELGTYGATWLPGYCDGGDDDLTQISSSDPTKPTEYVGTEADCLTWCELRTAARCCTWLGDDKQCKAHFGLGTNNVNPGNRSYFRLDGLARKSECTECPPGQYNDILGLAAPCKKCETGTYNKKKKQKSISACKLCDAGKYNDVEAQSACKNCPEGTYLVDDAKDAVAHDNIDDCIICAEGTYNDQDGRTNEIDACRPCPTGRTNRDNRQDRFKHDEIDDCKTCPHGKFNDIPGSITCKDCPAGKSSKSNSTEGYGPEDESRACAVCEKGKYQQFSGQKSCSECPAGRYLDLYGKTSLTDCFACGVGRYFQPSVAKPVAGDYGDCTLCPSGYFNEYLAVSDPDGTKHASCAFCPQGWYQPDTNASSCIRCGAGKFNAFKAKATEIDACQNCPEGFFGLGTAASRCGACEQGQYGETEGAQNEAAACANCPGGSVTLSDGLTACTYCGPGFYLPGSKAGKQASCLACAEQNQTGATDCPGCLSGQYGKISDSGGCTVCPNGRYNPGGNIAQCYECPAGFHQEAQYNPDASTNLYFKARCMACAQGKYSNQVQQIDSNSCNHCAAGFHGTAPGLTRSADACTGCLPGRFNTQTGQAYDTACQKCPEGKWSDQPRRDTNCVDCLIGTYNDVTGSTSACDPCMKGQYQGDPGKGECDLCEPGQTQTDIGATACVDCDIGMFSSQPTGSPSILRCEPCPKGYAQPGQGKSLCVKCQPGTIARFTKGTTCEDCPSGRYDVTGVDFCTECPPGKFQKDIGSSLCFDCRRGFWQPHEGQKSCEPCKSGYYQDRAGSLRCKACQVGTTTKGKSGSQECVDCAEGRVDSGSIHIDDGCSPCPAGQYRSTFILQCTDCGYGEYSAEVGAATCNDCMPGFYQDSTASTGCKECAVDFFNGDMHQAECTACETGMTTIHFNRSTECIICPEGRYGKNSTLGCIDCSPGMFREYRATNASGALQCNACPLGYVNDKSGQAACSKCAPGFFQNATGMKECVPCKPLEFQSASGSQSCLLCAIGQYTSNFSSAICQNCVGGKYGTGPGKPCSGCPIGWAREANGPINCTACPAGSHTGNMSNTSICTQCSRGSYQSEEGQPLCHSCNKPELDCEDEESRRISECRFQDNPGKARCEKCEDGLIPDPTAVMCIKPTWTTEKECQLGQALNNSNKVEKSEWTCQACPSGAACSLNSIDGPPTVIANVGHTDRHWSVYWDCEVGAGREDGGYRCNTDRARPLDFPVFMKCPFPNACKSSKESWARWRAQSNVSRALENAVQKIQMDASCRKLRTPLQSYMTKRYPNGTGIGTPGPSLCPENTCPTCAPHIEKAIEDWLDEQVGKKIEWMTKGRRLDEASSQQLSIRLPAFFTQARKAEALRWTGIFEPCDTVEGSEEDVYCLTKIGATELELSGEDEIFKTMRRMALRSTGLFKPCEGLKKNGFCPIEWDGDTDADNNAIWNSTDAMKKLGADYQKIMLGYYRQQYYIANMRVDTCTDTTTGPLCALCKEGFFRESRTSAECSQCTPGTVPIRFGALIGILMSMFSFAYFIKKKAVAMHEQIMHTLRHIQRLLVINMSYFQVATSLPRLIYIEWPSEYVTMLDSMSFVNIDIVALLGLKCVKVKNLFDIDNDFRMSIVVMTCVPIIWGLVVFCVWLIHAHKIGMSDFVSKEKNKEKRLQDRERMAAKAITYIYDVVDFNQDGFIDDREFPKILSAVNLKGLKKLHHRDILEIMDAIGATHIHGNRYLHDDTSSSEDEQGDGNFYNYDHEHHADDELDHDSEPLLRVTCEQMVDAAQSGILNKYFGPAWMSHANANRIRSLYMSVALLFMFFMHAPISQRYFYYFACHDVGGRHFMRGDYTLRCHIGKHQDFKVFVVFVMMAFTFAFPSFLLHKLYVNRKSLRKPQVAQKYGFLYKNFSEGAEAWELHEITRKCILIGGLVFVERTSDKCMVAVCICLLSICLISFYKPHPHRAVFAVELMSFLFTCMKYFSVVLLDIKAITKATAATTDHSDQKGLGFVLIGLDLTFAFGSAIVCTGAILHAIKLSLEEKKAKKQHIKNTKYLDLKLKSAKLVKKLKKKQAKKKSQLGESSNAVAVVTLISLVALVLPTPSAGLGCTSGYYCTNNVTSLCHTANASCSLCPAGQYADTPASVSCKACPLSGSILDDVLRNASAPVRHCESCTPGQHSGVLGYPACKPCVAGRSSSEWNETWCSVCPAGRYTNRTGSSACDDCPLGGAIEDAGGTAFSGPFAELLSELRHNQITDCTACPLGRYHDVTMAKGQTNISNCLSCPLGKYNDDDATDAKQHLMCTDCPKGSYGDTQGETNRKCTPCPSGTYNDLTNKQSISDCKVCVAGKYLDTPGSKAASACKDCPEGTYLDDVAANAANHDMLEDCHICGLGKYNPTKGMTAAGHCLNCQRGHFNAIGATVASEHVKCSECPAGYYQNQVESGSCKECDAGRSSNSLKRESVCDECEQGRYTDAVKSVSCTACPVGLHGGNSVASATGRSSKASGCDVCPKGKTTTTPGQNSCSNCPINTYLPEAMVGEGAYCIVCDTATAGQECDVNQATDCECLSKSHDVNQANDCGNLAFAGDGGCKTCTFGKYGQWDSSITGGDRKATCVSCNAGKYAFGGDSNKCETCPNGWYSDSDGAGVCTPCPSGKYSDAVEQKLASDCVACGTGEFGSNPKGGATDKDTGCQKCPKGTYSASSVASDIRACLDCGPGKYSASKGSDICQDCAPGKAGPHSRMVASAGTGGCEDCEAGLFSNVDGSKACKKCEPGAYVESLGKTSCKLCAPGTYEGKSASKLCAACPEGFFQPGSGKKSCVACSPGKDNRYKGKKSCNLCTSGMFEPSSASTGCKECPEGFHQPRETTAVDCKSCDAGFFQDKVESPGCDYCPTGFYTRVSESESCKFCPEGYSAEARGAIRCNLCPSGRFTKPNATECSDCPVGTYRTGNEENYQALVCTNCPEGKFEPDTGKSFCKFCESGKFSNEPGSAACTPCEAEKFTPNVNSTSCKRCPPRRNHI